MTEFLSEAKGSISRPRETLFLGNLVNLVRPVCRWRWARDNRKLVVRQGECATAH